MAAVVLDLTSQSRADLLRRGFGGMLGLCYQTCDSYVSAQLISCGFDRESPRDRRAGVGCGDGVRPGRSGVRSAADCYHCEDDGQVCLDRVARAAVDRTDLQVGFGHPE